MRFTKRNRFNGRDKSTGLGKPAAWLLAMISAAAAFTAITAQRAFADNCGKEQDFFAMDSSSMGDAQSYGTASRMWVKNHKMDSACSTSFDWSVVHAKGTDTSQEFFMAEFGYRNLPGGQIKLVEC